MNAHEIAELAKKEIATLTGLEVDTISAVTREEDRWHVTLDMVELRKIPNTQDMLATYEVELSANDHNSLLSYRRSGRYRRDQLAIAHA
jgi:Gas vesicle synthesis protein GvpO